LCGEAVMSEAGGTAPAPGATPAGGEFSEDIYLRLNPDVRLAVGAGKFRSGREHYERYGRAEGRPAVLPATLPRDRLLMTGNDALARDTGKAPACALDMIRVSRSGAIFLTGWVNDALDPIDCLELYVSTWCYAFDKQSLARVRRPDTEAALANSGRHNYGFWGFTFTARRLQAGVCSVVVRLKSGLELSLLLNAEPIEDHEMRKLALSHLSRAEYFGNPYFEAVASIEHAIGAQLVDFNKMLSRRAVNEPYVERFGQTLPHYRGSIIVCLYGKVEYMFLQQALFAKQHGIEDYEFIYVSNSAYIAEPLLKEARLCAQIYGLDMTLVILNANAGFGAANNLAAAYANSDRLIIMNPDVFPHGPDWAARHTALLDTLPPARTDLFGAPLYYDDGSLMHGGMYFALDTMPSFASGRKAETSILRVEHYGKGAPPEATGFTTARPVPAVTGAFISTSRAWFERLGGFTTDYVFGHYEDADLCLKSIEAGRPPWLHDIKLWHLEGKGSARRPQHEGGSAVNRWLFTKNWAEMVAQDLLGPHPSRPGLAAP